MRRCAPLLHVALLALLLPAGADAQSLQNRATATSNGVPLNVARATVNLQRTGNAVTSAAAEISPNAANAGASGQHFVIDTLVRIGAGDSGFDTLAVTAPAGWRNLAATGLTVGGAALVSGCPAPAAGAYCATANGTALTVVFGTRIGNDRAHVQLSFDARAAAQAGTATFTVNVDDATSTSIAPQTASAGNADGDAGDANNLDVTLTTVAADALRSGVTADPPIVRADGVAESTITVRLRDAHGNPIAGREVVLSSARGGLDVLVQPLGPTDANGVVHGTIRSTMVGPTTITATATVGNVVLHDHPPVTFTRGIVLDLAKQAGEQRYVVGDAVAYRIEL